VKTAHIAIALVVWVATAAMLVRAGALARIFPPPVILALALTVIVSALTVPALRAWVRRADLRLLLLPHLIRFVGAVFLVLVGKGVLSPAFTPIGWGDLGSAIGAVALLLIGRPDPQRSIRWWLWLVWNIAGCADMILLVMTGIRVGLTSPEQFALFRTLPFGLLPTFAVPLIIATHVLIFVRLFARR
jgi:hypothetical protein